MNKIVTHVAVGAVALGVGITSGYLIGNRRAWVKASKELTQGIDELNEFWTEKITELEGTPGYSFFNPKDNPDVSAIITSGETLATEEGASYPFVDQAKDFDSVEEVEPDFPDELDVSEDFTVEGEAPHVDAKAFIEQFKNRSLDEFSGVSYPGHELQDTLEFDILEEKVSSVPSFKEVRNPNGPYVISIDNYMDPETDPPFTKVEMLWFQGDNVVVDSRGDQVPMSTVGQPNTLRFGDGTTDPNQVYIRNERLSIDIELTREEGLYLHEVLGQDFPDKSPVFKMRESDDS